MSLTPKYSGGIDPITGKISESVLPDSVMQNRGGWDASTNTPTLADGIGNLGDVYNVTVDGTQDLGSGSIDFSIGDSVQYNGTIWFKSSATSVALSGDVIGSGTGTVTTTISNNAVTNAKLSQTSTGIVKARTTEGIGNIEDVDIATTFKTALSLTKTDIGLSNVQNVDQTNATNITSGTLNALRLPTGINAANIADGSVNNAEFQYLDGVTSSIQTQISAQVPKSLYDSDTILKADTDDTPVALSVTASTFVGRKSSGGISAMSIAEAKTELGASSANGLATLDGTSKVPDNQISTSSVTQHQASIDHNQLLNYTITEHRTINDAGTATTELWSANKISSELSLISQGYFGKADVKAVTEGTGNNALSGLQTIHGYTLLAGDRVGVTDQTDPIENGVYIADSLTWSRAIDYDGNPDGEVKAGTFYFVSDNDNTYAKKRFVVLGSGTIIVDTDPINYSIQNPIEFGSTAGTAAEGNDSRIPTQDENDALVGDQGTPSSSNTYLTQDSIGVTAQAYDSDLSEIAGLTPTNDDFIQRKSGSWTNRTATQVTADLDAFVGDSGSGGTKGLVPAPSSGDAASDKFLKANGSWSIIPQTGLTISAKTNGVGSPYSILTGDSGTYFTNTGATEEAYLNLPSAISGLIYYGICTDSDLIRFVANGSDTIRDGSIESTSGGYIQLTEVGATVSLICVEAGKWMTLYANGSINII